MPLIGAYPKRLYEAFHSGGGLTPFTPSELLRSALEWGKHMLVYRCVHTDRQRHCCCRIVCSCITGKEVSVTA
jgi:hypothetical protein